MASAAPIYEEDDAEAVDAVSARPLDVLAAHEGDLSFIFSDTELAELGSRVVRDYEFDRSSRREWETTVEEALKVAAQEEESAKNWPWQNASDVHFPILTQSAIEFNARAYPAIVKGDETILVKVVGADKGRPELQQTPQGIVPVTNPETGEITWAVPPGAKAARAGRVREYLNTYLLYRMDDWEADTDALLLQLPIVGCGFRKCWWANGKHHSAYVPALKLVVHMDAKSLKTVPRKTEEIDGVYPNEIRQRMRRGEYREVELTPVGEDKDAARTLLEQHLLMDADDDGLDEPYIVTVDKESQQVLKIEANFGPDDIEWGQRAANDDVVDEADDGRIALSITPTTFYVKYEFFPHPKGKFYSIGFGHLLKPLTDIVNTCINQLFDAATAANAGGGFIAAGLRFQGRGQNNTLRFAPGEYKTVNATGSALRDGIVERTFPTPSPITFQLLDLMLGAAKDLAALKDVTSGDASNNGQVGTTLALIEQGLKVFNAVYKRVFRAEREEFGLMFSNIGRWGGEAVAQDYIDVLDDPQADFAKDFSETDMDIRPVSDPDSVTRLQKMARAQFLLETGKGDPNVDQRELLLRVYAAADIEDVEKLVPEKKDDGPPPPMVADMAKTQSEIKLNEAKVRQIDADIAGKGIEAGHKLGMSDDTPDAGGVPGMAGPSGDGVGGGGAEPVREQPQIGMEPTVVGSGAV